MRRSVRHVKSRRDGPTAEAGPPCGQTGRGPTALKRHGNKKGGPKPAFSVGYAEAPHLPALAPPLAVLAAAAALAPVSTGWAALGHLLRRLTLGAGDLLAGGLIDDLHGKAPLAAVVEAQELAVGLLALLPQLPDPPTRPAREEG